MEALLEDQVQVAQPGTHGEPDLAHDGHELEAPGKGTGAAVGFFLYFCLSLQDIVAIYFYLLAGAATTAAIAAAR